MRRIAANLVSNAILPETLVFCKGKLMGGHFSSYLANRGSETGYLLSRKTNFQL